MAESKDPYDYGTMRVCPSCRLMKPLAEFDYTKSNIRICCIECVEQDKQTKKLVKATARRDEALKMVIAEVSGTKINVPHISELAAEMVHQLGGLEEFCQLWKYHIYACLERNPASNTLASNLKALSNMILQSTQERMTAPDVQTLTDEELEKELQTLMGASTRIMAESDPEEEVA